MKTAQRVELGRLLLYQSGATVFRSLTLLFGSLLCWGVAVLIFLTKLRGELPFYFPLALLAGGIFLIPIILFGRLKSIACYEQGVVIKNLRGSQAVLFKDIVGIRFSAVQKYSDGIFEGISFHFEVMPYVEKTVKVKMFGSIRDGRRIENIVLIILRSNSDAKLLDWT